MTYCVAMSLDQGLLFASDSRTNAGVDQISTFSKMSVFEQPGERVIVLLNAGNLATTQAVVSTLRRRMGSDEQNIMNVGSMFEVAELVGREVRGVISHAATGQLEQSTVDFSCTFCVGGQIGAEPPRLFTIYPEGNFIEATADTPYFQLGESKYGKPILDRVVRRDTPLREAVKCALVSFDSTIKSNLSVGLPIDLAIVRRDERRIGFSYRIESDEQYFRSLRDGWSQGLRRVFNELAEPPWLKV